MRFQRDEEAFAPLVWLAAAGAVAAAVGFAGWGVSEGADSVSNLADKTTLLAAGASFSLSGAIVMAVAVWRGHYHVLPLGLILLIVSIPLFGIRAEVLTDFFNGASS